MRVGQEYKTEAAYYQGGSQTGKDHGGKKTGRVIINFSHGIVFSKIAFSGYRKHYQRSDDGRREGPKSICSQKSKKYERCKCTGGG